MNKQSRKNGGKEFWFISNDERLWKYTYLWTNGLNLHWITDQSASPSFVFVARFSCKILRKKNPLPVAFIYKRRIFLARSCEKMQFSHFFPLSFHSAWLKPGRNSTSKFCAWLTRSHHKLTKYINPSHPLSYAIHWPSLTRNILHGNNFSTR